MEQTIHPGPIACLGGGPWSVPRECIWLLPTPDGKRLLVGGRLEWILFVDTLTGRVRERIHLGVDYIHEVDLHADGRRLAFAYRGGIRCIDLETGQELWELDTPHGIIRGLRFTPGGRHLFSVGIGNTVHYWNADSGRKAGPGMQLPRRAVGLATSPDCRTVAVGLNGGGYAWDRVGKRCKWELDGEYSRHGGVGEHAILFSHGGRRLWFTVAEPPYLRAYDLVGDRFSDEESVTVDFGDWVRAIALSPDGTRLAAMTRGELATLDVENGETLWTRNLQDAGLHRRDHFHESLSFSPDGERLWALSDHAGIWSWSSWDGVLLNDKEEHEYGIEGIRLSRSGRRLLVGTRLSKVHLWDVLSRRSVWIVQLPFDYESDRKAVRFRDLPGGRVGLDNAHFDAETEDGFTVDLDSDAQPQAATFPGQGRWMTSADGSLEARREQHEIAIHRPGEDLPRLVLDGIDGGAYSGLAFFPDGRMLVCQGRGGLVRFWSLASGELVHVHDESYLSGRQRLGGPVVVTSAGDRIAIAAEDGWVVLLELRRDSPPEGGESIRVSRSHCVRMHEHVVTHLGFSGDGTCLAAASDWEREVNVYRVVDLLPAGG